MGKTASIQARIDPELKRNALIILEKLNISMSEAITMYLSQIALHKKIPFEIKLPESFEPNETTVRALRDSIEGKNLHTVDSVEELFKELNK